MIDKCPLCYGKFLYDDAPMLRCSKTNHEFTWFFDEHSLEDAIFCCRFIAPGNKYFWIWFCENNSIYFWDKINLQNEIEIKNFERSYDAFVEFCLEKQEELVFV